MTRVFNLNDQLVFIARDNSLLDSNNKVLAKLKEDAIVANDDNVLAVFKDNQINDPKGQPLVWINPDNKVYFRGLEMCTLEGGNIKERALGAGGFLFFG